MADPAGAPADEHLTRRLRGVAIATTVVWGLVVLIWDEGPFAVTFDDAYYYFEIASRIADGQGSTFDGISETNGYHPLWMAICVIPYLLGVEGMAAVRVLLTVQVLLYGASLWVLAGVAGRAAGGWPRLAARTAKAARSGDAGGSDDAGGAGGAGDSGDAGGGRHRDAVDACRWSVVAAVALAVANPFVVRIAVSGLESILVVVVGVLLLERVLRAPGTLLTDRGTRQRAGTALLLVLAFLARTDSVLLVATVGVAGLAEIRRRSLGRRGIVELVGLLAPAAVTLVVYVVWNIEAFGGLQISGVVKRAPLEATNVIGFGVVLIGCAIAIVRSVDRADRLAGGATPRFGRTSAFTARTSWYGTFALLVVAYYSLLSVQQWLWYYAPAATWLLFLLTVTCIDLFEQGAVDARRDTAPSRALLPLRALVLVPLGALLVFQIRALADPEIRSIQLANRTAAEWASTGLPPDAVLASWDAGVLGYFADQPVVNLDGVVSGFDWYDATQEGGAAMAAELDAAGVTHIVNHGAIVDGEDPAIRPYVEALWGPEVAAAARVVESFPFVYSGTTVGSEGRSAGTRELAVWVYELPAPEAR